MSMPILDTKIQISLKRILTYLYTNWIVLVDTQIINQDFAFNCDNSKDCGGVRSPGYISNLTKSHEDWRPIWLKISDINSYTVTMVDAYD